MIKRTALLFSLSLLSILFYSVPANAQDEGGAAGVTMKLCDADGKTIATAITTDEGTWNFTVRQPGEYSIVVADDEFTNARRAINTKGTGSNFRTASTDGKKEAADDWEQQNRTISFSWSMKDDASVACVVSPRDAASGLPTGKRQHAPVQFIKDLERSTPTVTCTKACTISGTMSYSAKAGKTGRTK